MAEQFDKIMFLTRVVGAMYFFPQEVLNYVSLYDEKVAEKLGNGKPEDGYREMDGYIQEARIAILDIMRAYPDAKFKKEITRNSDIGRDLEDVIKAHHHRFVELRTNGVSNVVIPSFKVVKR
jgi:hypothetical protein